MQEFSGDSMKTCSRCGNPSEKMYWGICNVCHSKNTQKYYRENREKILKKRSEKLKQEKIKANIPVLEKLPGQVLKRCPLCNKRVYLYPEDDSGECPHCGKTFYVSHLLSDSTNKMNIGGVRLWALK